MTDYVTAAEAQDYLDGLAVRGAANWGRLSATVVHQAELLAEAREALQRIAWHGAPAAMTARAALARLARLDSQEQ